MKIEITPMSPDSDGAELAKLFAEFPSKAAIERAKYILNQYSKDSDADIQCLAFSLDRADRKLKTWEKCADDLVDYAHEFVANLSTWGKGYDRNDKQIKLAEDCIEAYKKLKNE